MQPNPTPLLHNFLLRHARERDRLSIEDMATAMHLPPAKYQAIEEGRSLLEQEDALALARLLSLPVDYIILSTRMMNLLHSYLQLNNKQKELERYLRQQHPRNYFSTQ